MKDSLFLIILSFRFLRCKYTPFCQTLFWQKSQFNFIYQNSRQRRSDKAAVMGMKFFNRMGSERVADGEVQGLAVAEAAPVEVAAAAGVVGRVQGQAPVDADDEEAEVVA